MDAALPILLADEHRPRSKYYPPFFTRLFGSNSCGDDVKIVKSSDFVYERGFYAVNLGTPYRLSRGAAARKGGGMVVYDGIDRSIFAQAANDGSKLLLDMMIEAIFPTQEIVEALIDGCNEYGIDPSALVIMNSNQRAASTLEKMFDERRLGGRPQILDVNACYWLIKGQNLLTPESRERLHARYAKAEAARTGVREKKFVSFNGRLRRHRFFVIAWLMAKGYLADGFVSLLGYSQGEAPTTDKLRTSIARYGDTSVVEPAIPQFLEQLPLTIDVGLEESWNNAAYVKVLPWISPQSEPYDQSYFSIVLDTSFDDGDTLFLTPIAYKSFMNFSPFVYFGNQGALAELRRLGFKTFAPFIDESYDDIVDNSERLKVTLAQVDRLMAMSKPRLADLHGDIWGRLTHNFWHLHRADVQGFRADCTDRLRSALQV